MNKQISQNIKQVTNELDAMLENVRKVRGHEYAQLVSALLHSKNIVCIWSFVLKTLRTNDATKEALDKAFMSNLEDMMTAFLGGMNLDTSNYTDAVRHAETFDKTIGKMLGKALQGEPFGDDNAS